MLACVTDSHDNNPETRIGGIHFMQFYTFFSSEKVTPRNFSMGSAT